MKVIGISSGLSYNGYTANLVRVALQSAANQGAMVEEIFIPDYEIKVCKGCSNCLAKGKCIINDDLELLRQKLNCADGIIIGTQSLGSEPDPAIQTFLTRIRFLSQYTSSLSDKYILAMATTETFGAHNAAKKITGLTSGYFKKGIISGTLGFNVNWEQIEHYPEYLGKIEIFSAKLINDIQRKRRFQAEGIFERIVNRLSIVPQVKKMVEAQKNGKMEAVYHELNLRGWLDEPETSSPKINSPVTAQP